jgi:chemotaxis protein MotB
LPGKLIGDQADQLAGESVGGAPGEAPGDLPGPKPGDMTGSEIGASIDATTPDDAEAAAMMATMTPDQARAFAAERAEQARLEAIGQQIAEAVERTDDGALERHFVLRITPEGLVIEIIDADDQPLFDSASAQPAPILQLLIDVLVPVLDHTVNDIAVVGHTDAVAFDQAGYSNWELSADRANAARRLLAASGLPEDRVVRVTGKAAVEPLSPDPFAPQNRRIAITLLRPTGR